MTLSTDLTNLAGFIANLLSTATPVVLLIWFLVTSKRQLAHQYYSEFPGEYGGFTKPIDEGSAANHGGVLLRILNIDANGYFQGEFDFGENASWVQGNQLYHQQLRDGIHTCMGRMVHQIYPSKDRNPMLADENRVYKGKFYVVDRLDIDFRSYNINQYIQREYEITHFREMKTIELKLIKVHRELNELPSEVTLYKKLGLRFDVYESVQETSFRGD